MKVTNTEFEGLLIIEPQIFTDDRGYFYESYNEQKLKEFIPYIFVQDNQSLSKKDVLRGMHFQKPPFDQGKLVRVIKGSALDVVVDVRKKSATYSRYFTILLSEQNNLMLWIPPGFAHGFLSLEDNTIFSYKCTNYYHKESEECLLWNDPAVNIKWNVQTPLVADKDKQGKLLNNLPAVF